jgi:RNA polymerase sigma-70 factor, ECF subfamily
MPVKSNGRVQAQTDVIEHIDGLFSYALVLTRNDNEADYLVQETYNRAFEAIEQRRTSGNAKSWMFTTLRNIWLGRLRRPCSASEAVSIDEDNSSVMGTTRNFRASDINRNEQMKVREAIQQLPLDFREVILLREYAELSCPEIAKILNCPLVTVMSRLAAARAKLRIMLSAILQTLAREGKSTAPKNL